MEPDRIMAEINRLSLPQKLILAQDIWDSIALYNDKLPMPNWQKNELTKRYAQFKKGDMELYGWQEVHEKLRERHK